MEQNDLAICDINLHMYNMYNRKVDLNSQFYSFAPSNFLVFNYKNYDYEKWIVQDWIKYIFYFKITKKMTDISKDYNYIVVSSICNRNYKIKHLC